MRQHWTLVADLGFVAFSAFVALLIRDNFVVYEPHWQAIVPYAAITLACTAVIFGVLRPHRALWQYISLPDILYLIAAVTLALLLSLFASFALSRLEGIARSIPVIQWLLLIVAMVAVRVAARIWRERKARARPVKAGSLRQHVLIVGESQLTELYLESLERYVSKRFKVEGILSDRREFRGRLLRRLKILGTPEELTQAIEQLGVHGVTVERIVVVQPMRKLSLKARDDLLSLERNSEIRVDWLLERLGFDEGTTVERLPDDQALEGDKTLVKFSPRRNTTNLGRYGYLKRALDLTGATFLCLLLAPVILSVGLIVAIDVGLPVLFWQQRPGRAGHPFKLYKFCTMRAAHDSDGNRIPDQRRSSLIGHLLRRTRLDELPQLYNILVGEMSFVGPRPLLPLDQPDDPTARLSVRPGLTGLAQVIGERDMLPADKNALDIWYIRSASLWLDFQILLRTFFVVIRGERIDHHTLEIARGRAQVEIPTGGAAGIASAVGE
jgi:lipopolysaccharide/colanic/teichoic acid biosynthesis glycosyltransferase